LKCKNYKIAEETDFQQQCSQSGTICRKHFTLCCEFMWSIQDWTVYVTHSTFM